MLQKPDPHSLHVITENGEQCFVWRHNQLTYIAQDKQELPLVFGLKFGNLATKLDLSYNSLTSYGNINLFTNLNELVLDNNCLEDDQLDFKQNLRLKILSLNKNKLKDLYRLISAIKICFPNLEFLSLIGNPLCPSPISLSLYKPERTPAASVPTNSQRDFNHQDRKEEISGGEIRPDVGSSARIAETAAILQLVDEEDNNFEFALQKYRYFIIYHLPNLHFLDSSQITDQERDEALRRCYWMRENFSSFGTSRPANIASQNEHHANNNNNNTNGFVARSRNSPAANGQQPAAETYLDLDGGALQPNNSSASLRRQRPETLRGNFSRLSYKYTGKNSEGNRFIRDQDL